MNTHTQTKMACAVCWYARMPSARGSTSLDIRRSSLLALTATICLAGCIWDSGLAALICQLTGTLLPCINFFCFSIQQCRRIFHEFTEGPICRSLITWTCLGKGSLSLSYSLRLSYMYHTSATKLLQHQEYIKLHSLTSMWTTSVWTTLTMKTLSMKINIVEKRWTYQLRESKLVCESSLNPRLAACSWNVHSIATMSSEPTVGKNKF